MLTEWLTWLAADCTKPARRLGYLRESIAIRSRHRRCRTEWQPHLTNSRAALLDSLQACSSFRTALVFGSGLLLDIPLDELARRFGKVYLVDVVHLPEVKRAVRLHANVRCIDLDVTGFIEHMDALSPERLELPPPERFLDEPDIDWVASVNLLSQLPLLPADWLRHRFPELDEAMLEAWGAKVMRQHLDYLATFAAPACLLADMEQVVHACDGEIIEQIDFAHRLGLDERASEQWRWNIAPPGEIAPGIASFHRIAAYPSFRWPESCCHVMPV